MVVHAANCAELGRPWLQQAMQSLRAHMTLLGWYGTGAKFPEYRDFICMLVCWCCSFIKLLKPNRMQPVGGVSAARTPITHAPILAREDEIDASSFSSDNAIHDLAHGRFLLSKLLAAVIGLPSSSRLVTRTCIYCVASVTSASHGPAL